MDNCAVYWRDRPASGGPGTEDAVRNYRRHDLVAVDPDAARARGWGSVHTGAVVMVDYDQVFVRPTGADPWHDQPFPLGQVAVLREWIAVGDLVRNAGMRGVVQELVYCSGPDGYLGWHGRMLGDDGTVHTVPVSSLARVSLQAELAAA